MNGVEVSSIALMVCEHDINASIYAPPDCQVCFATVCTRGKVQERPVYMCVCVCVCVCVYIYIYIYV